MGGKDEDDGKWIRSSFVCTRSAVKAFTLIELLGS